MAEWVGQRLREADEREIRASTGEDPVDVLVRSYHLSEECRLIYSPGSFLPCALFGIVKAQVPVVWMVCTPDIKENPRYVLRSMQVVADRWAEEYGGLQALAMADNYLHVRWCRHLGFKEIAPRQINGHQFIHIYRPPTKE